MKLSDYDFTLAVEVNGITFSAETVEALYKNICEHYAETLEAFEGEYETAFGMRDAYGEVYNMLVAALLNTCDDTWTCSKRLCLRFRNSPECCLFT